MGQEASKGERLQLKASIPEKREYRLPEVRKLDRYDRADDSAFSPNFESSVDKFDYLLVFPLTEGSFKPHTPDEIEGARKHTSEVVGVPIKAPPAPLSAQAMQALLMAPNAVKDAAKKLRGAAGVTTAGKQQSHQQQVQQKEGGLVTEKSTDGDDSTAAAASSGSAAAAVRLSTFNTADMQRRVKWADVSAVWRAAVPGSEEKKDASLQELAAVWERRSGALPQPLDRLRWTAWLSVLREALLEQLSARIGLQLRLTANDTHIFCRVRAPLKLLELQADRDDYKLQLQEEIDPGCELFWNLTMEGGRSVELEEERRQLELEDACIILERLYQAGKISAVDLKIDPQSESKAQWSRRVHALERIADKVPVSNDYPAYCSFYSTKPHLRYLYQKHRSTRGETIFQTRDRLLLTNALIQHSIDVRLLVDAGFVTAYFALHDANRGEALNAEILSRRWIGCLTAAAHEVGAPCVSNSAYRPDCEASFFQRLFCQPFLEIRSYFGEKIALYAAYLGFFSCWLLAAALLGAAMELVIFVRGYSFTIGHLDYFSYVYVLLIISWATLFEQCWHRECAAIAVKWGTRGYEEQERPRSAFTGDKRKPLKRSSISNQRETYFPESRRTCIALGSNLQIALLLLSDLLLLAAIFYAQSFCYFALGMSSSISERWWVDWVVAVLLASTMSGYSLLFEEVAIKLNNAENYRTETDYEDALVTKVIQFEVVNSLAACVFTAFGKGPLLGTCVEDNCAVDLRHILYVIMAFRLLSLIRVCVTALVQGWYRRVRELSKLVLGSRRDADETLLIMHDEIDEDISYIEEFRLRTFKDTTYFVRYRDLFMQFSYIVLFSVVMPFFSVMSLAECLIKMRVQAFELCYLFRRPHVLRAEDAGLWADSLGTMTLLGIFLAVAVFSLSESGLSSVSTLLRVIIFLLLSQLLILYVAKLKSYVPAEAEAVEETARRQQFVVDKFAKGIDSDDAELLQQLSGSGSSGGNIDDKVNLDALQLYDINKGLVVPEQNYSQIELLQKERLELENELKLLREKLQDAYKAEKFNDHLGVGETKHGLPLGRLSVHLVEIRHFTDPELLQELGPKPLLKIRVDFEGTKAGATAPVPNFETYMKDTSLLHLQRVDEDTTLAEAQSLGVEDGRVPIHQSLGPFAPVRSIHANVVFNVLNMSPRARIAEANVATAFIALRDLHDQLQHDKIISLKVRAIDGSLKPSEALLYVNLAFQYSKVVPIRTKIYALQDKIDRIDKQMATLKLGL